MNRKLLAPLSFLALLTIIYSSCTRIDTTDIGNGLIPPIDNINTFDTILDVVTDNFLFNDSSRIFDNEDHALGSIQNDPLFGKLSANIYFNLTPATFATYPFITKDSIKQVDSVVLSMGYTGVYGDSLSTQTFGVYELQNDTRFKDSVTGYLISHDAINLGPLLKTHSQDFDKLNDASVIMLGKDTQQIKNQMRIRLDNSLAQRFINYDTSVYRNDTTFRNAFAGFGILPQGGGQTALAYFNLANTDNTKLTIYYKAKSLNGVIDTALVTTFTFKNFRNLNKIERNIAGSELGTVLNNGSEADENLYIATSPGTYATLKIPALQGLSNRVIHRAELIATTITPPGSAYQAPYYLFLDAWDSAVSLPKTIQNDFTYNATSGTYNQLLFGGFLTKDASGKELYNFDISRYVQGIVTRKEKSYTLRLYAPYKTATVYIPGGVASGYDVAKLNTEQKASGAVLYLNPQIANGRTVLGGGNHPTSKMKLRIIYSRI
ncbi:MAG: DUF4270 family protein [Sphingobacteriales bacterium]|nr:MAG: DUF4270 family protein [Sphingobacteriales bacterium]